MGLQRRKRNEIREARAAGRPTTSRADIESEYLERADEPLRKQEFTTRAFNIMWTDFFRLFAAMASAASAYVVFRSVQKREFHLAIFHAHGIGMFLLARRWLVGADILLEHDSEGIFGKLNRDFQTFALACAMQMLFIPAFIASGQPQSTWSKCFPSGFVFLAVCLLVIAFMRHNLKSTLKYRTELNERLFGHSN